MILMTLMVVMGAHSGKGLLLLTSLSDVITKGIFSKTNLSLIFFIIKEIGGIRNYGSK